MKLKKNEVAGNQGYLIFLNLVKADIQQAQLQAAFSITRELTFLYSGLKLK